MVHLRDPEETSRGILLAALVSAVPHSAVSQVDGHHLVGAPRFLVHPASEVGRLSVGAGQASVADRHLETGRPRAEREYPKCGSPVRTIADELIAIPAKVRAAERADLRPQDGQRTGARQLADLLVVTHRAHRDAPMEIEITMTVAHISGEALRGHHEPPIQGLALRKVVARKAETALHEAADRMGLARKVVVRKDRQDAPASIAAVRVVSVAREVTNAGQVAAKVVARSDPAAT